MCLDTASVATFEAGDGAQAFKTNSRFKKSKQLTRMSGLSRYPKSLAGIGIGIKRHGFKSFIPGGLVILNKGDGEMGRFGDFLIALATGTEITGLYGEKLEKRINLMFHHD